MSALGGRKKLVSASRSGRVLARLEQSMKLEKYYEAHQTIRVLYQRYLAQNRDKDALDILYTGARFLLEHQQWESGTELAVLMVTHLKTKNHAVSDKLIDTISELFHLYKEDEEERGGKEGGGVGEEKKAEVDKDQSNRDQFMRAALKWSSVATGGMKYGHPELHKLLALAHWKEKTYEKATKHFLYAGIPDEYGHMLVEFATECGYPGEVELFIAQAVLQLLVLHQKDEAYATFLSYCGKHPTTSDQMPPPFRDFPLLNFTWFLLLAIDIGNAEVFQCLWERYTPAISRDPMYVEYLSKIGVKYFGMPEQQKEATPTNLFSLLTGAGPGLGDLATNLPSFLSSSTPPVMPAMALQDATDALD